MDLKTLLASFMGWHHRYRLADVKFTTSAQTCEGHGADETPRPKKPKEKAAKPKVPKYKRLGHDKRVWIETLRSQGVRQAEIARIIGGARSTICNELKRNGKKTKKGEMRYKAKKADVMARRRAAQKAADRRKMTPEVWAEVKAKLELGWTPEMICERARRDGKPSVCRELIYQEYYRRQKLVLAGLSDEKLPLLPKRRKQRKTRDRNAKKYSRDAGRGKIRERVDIDQRPKNVLNRKRVGHWEGDLINGRDGTAT